MTESELNSKFQELGLSNEAMDSNSNADESISDAEYIDKEPKNIIIGMISQLKNGMDLHKVPFPTFVLEPRSMLERITDFVSHPHLILKYKTFMILSSYFLVHLKNLIHLNALSMSLNIIFQAGIFAPRELKSLTTLF